MAGPGATETGVTAAGAIRVTSPGGRMCYFRDMRSIALAGALAGLLFAGCASSTALVDGRQVPRVDFDFVGQPYVVRVSGAHPRPGSPSGGLKDNGGHVSGNVCGLEITFDVEHRGDYTHLTGFIDDGALDSAIDVRDEKGISRHIDGKLSENGGTVHLDLRKNHIYGNVGLRQFELARRGDQYLGWLKIRQSVVAKAVVNGADALWELPPAAQAVVLPALLTCYGDGIEDKLGTSFQVGFGGRQTWEAKHVSSIYHNNTTDVQRQMLQGQFGKSSTVGGQ